MKRTVRMLKTIALVGLLLGIAAVGGNEGVAAATAIVSVNAPAQVVKGSPFTVTVDITNTTALDAGQFDVSFDESVIQLDDVTAGVLGTTQIPIALWNKLGTGTYRIIVNVPGVPGVNGSGYLAVLHFHALSSVGNSSAVSLSNGFLNNNLGSEITATWAGDSVNVSEPLVISTTSLPDTVTGSAYAAKLGAAGGNGNCTWSVLSGSLPGGLSLSGTGTISGTPTTAGSFTFTVKVTDGQLSDSKGLTIKVTPRSGDANGDGVINSADITTVERIIVGLEGTSPSADANQDGKTNTADITKIERIIVGLG